MQNNKNVEYICNSRQMNYHLVVVCHNGNCASYQSWSTVSRFSNEMGDCWGYTALACQLPTTENQLSLLSLLG